MVVMYTSPPAPATYQDTYEWHIQDDTGDIDLSTIVSGVFKVKDPTGAETTWTVTLTWFSSSSTLVAAHTMTNELTMPGAWSVYVILTDGTGKVYRVPPRELVVLDRYDYSKAK